MSTMQLLHLTVCHTDPMVAFLKAADSLYLKYLTMELMGNVKFKCTDMYVWK